MLKLCFALITLAVVVSAGGEYGYNNYNNVACEYGWFKSGDLCYRRSASTTEGGAPSNKWYRAKKDCESKGATLVTGVTAATLAALRTTPFEGTFWIGLHTAQAGVFHWLDEFGIVPIDPATNGKWFKTLPTATTEGCVTLDTSVPAAQTGVLDVVSCENKYAWYCQKPLSREYSEYNNEYNNNNYEKQYNGNYNTYENKYNGNYENKYNGNYENKYNGNNYENKYNGNYESKYNGNNYENKYNGNNYESKYNGNNYENKYNGNYENKYNGNNYENKYNGNSYETSKYGASQNYYENKYNGNSYGNSEKQYNGNYKSDKYNSYGNSEKQYNSYGNSEKQYNSGYRSGYNSGYSG